MVGIDVIKISRFKSIKKREYSLWNKCFSKDEWEYAFSKPDPFSSLAGIFAAKEAVIKSIGASLIDLNRVTINHLNHGMPYAKVKGQKGRLPVSISHDGGIAVAIAISSKK